MKPNIKRFFLIIAAAIVSASCIELISIEGEETDPMLNVSASISDSDSSIISVSYLYHTMRNQSWKHVIDTLNIFASVNGGEQFALDRIELFSSEKVNGKYDSLSHACFSFKHPVSGGDEVELFISDPKNVYPNTTAKTTIPYHNHDISVVEVESPCWTLADSIYVTTEDLFAPGVIEPVIKLKIKDQPGEKNYYFLDIKQSSNLEPEPTDSWATSEDAIFKDEWITRTYGNRITGQSSIFDDSLFDGQEYVFSIKTSLSRIYYVVSELYSITFSLYQISEDEYKHRKTFAYASCSKDDFFSEPVQIFTNISPGYGIFGSHSVSKCTILFKIPKATLAPPRL